MQLNCDERHQGCNCSKEWTGEHCQYHSREFMLRFEPQGKHILEWILLAISFGILLALAVHGVHRLVGRIRERRKRRQAEKARNTNLAVGALHDIDEAFNPYDDSNHLIAGKERRSLIWD